ncbi:MAG: hypothetical protein HUU20_00455 [Pirellulales bacterium]|nr:hypothetical protein [Pirellulales bacterium]
MKVPVPAASPQPAAAPEDRDEEYRLLLEERQAPALSMPQPSGGQGAPVSGGSKADRSFLSGFEGTFAPEKKGIEKGILGGMLMIVIAVVWFVAGLAAGYIFYYPPILFIIGMYALLKGLFTGNITGQRGSRR